MITTDKPKRGRKASLLVHPCDPAPEGCGAPVGVRCTSQTGKVLTAGHACRRYRAGLKVTTGRNANARPEAATRTELDTALQRAAQRGRGVHLSQREVRLLVEGDE